MGGRRRLQAYRSLEAYRVLPRVPFGGFFELKATGTANGELLSLKAIELHQSGPRRGEALE